MSNDIRSRISAILAKYASVKGVGSESELLLIDAGLDSLSLEMLLSEVEEDLGVDIEPLYRGGNDIETVRQLVDAICRLPGL